MPSLRDLHEQLAAQNEQTPLKCKSSRRSYNSISSGSTVESVPDSTSQYIPVGVDRETTSISLNRPPAAGSASKPYKADFIELPTGEIVSYDDRLNQDGDALFQFLIQQGKRSSPSYQVHCTGERIDPNFTLSTHEDLEAGTDERRTITDFDFKIDVPAMTSHLVQWSLPDHDPAYRGQDYPEVAFRTGVKQPADMEEIDDAIAWAAERAKRGLPPWAPRIQTWEAGDVPDEYLAIRSTKTLREWTAKYCAKSGPHKEFVYNKLIYGWDLRHLENSIASVIQGSGYNGNVTVKFSTRGAQIIIKPNASLLRLLHDSLKNPILKHSLQAFLFLFILTIISFVSLSIRHSQHPPMLRWLPWLCFGAFTAAASMITVYIYIPSFLHTAVARWEVCGSAHPMYRWEPLPACSPEARNYKNYPEGSFCDPDHRFLRTPSSVSKLNGATEEEWFMKWEGSIRRAVGQRLVSDTPITIP